MQLISFPDIPQDYFSLDGSIHDGTCEDYFQQLYLLDGFIDDGTCEDYFQQLYLLDGRQVTTLRSLQGVGRSIDDGTCKDYFQQLYLLDGRQVTTLRSLPGVGRSIHDGTCEDYFQQLYLLDGFIDDGTCEDYFQQLYLLDGRQVTTLRSLQGVGRSIDDGTCKDYFQQLYLLDGFIDDGTCEDYFQQLYLLDGRQVTTLRSLQGVGRRQVPLMMEPAKTLPATIFTRWHAGSIDDGTCEDYFQQLYLLDGRQVTTLRSLQGVGRRQVPLMMEPAKTTSSNYIYSMHGFKIIPVIQGLHAGSIDDGTCEDYFQQLYLLDGRQVTTLRSLQGVGRSIDDGTCKDYFQQLYLLDGSIDDGTCEDYFQQLYLLDGMQVSIDDGTCEDYFQQLYLLDGRQVTTLRSLPGVGRSIDDGTCEDYFQQLYLLDGSIDDGTCEDYFQQLYLLDGRQVTTLRSLPGVGRSIHDGTCEDYFQQLYLLDGSIDDGTCEDYFQQLYLLDGRQVTTLRSLPGVGRMQVPLMMEPAKTTSSNYINSMHGFKIIPVIQGLHAGFIDDGTCEDYFQQLYLLDGRQVTTLRSLPGIGRMQVPLMMEPAKTIFTRWHAGSIDDGTCEDYFQQLCIAKYSLSTRAGSIDVPHIPYH
ncbi:hypothetical protein EMCRGX_G021441 [Ephydatia muelleri]